MEIIRGKKTHPISPSGFTAILEGYSDILLDIGTGDGRFIHQEAELNSRRFCIGIDACRENLRVHSRNAPGNALYIIANAQALPDSLNGLANHVTINFPWGSLLTGLLNRDSDLMNGLCRITRPGALLEVRLNGGALAEAGWLLEDGTDQVRKVVQDTGFAMKPPAAWGSSELRNFPTSWGKRLAFGRDPHARYLKGIRL